MSLELHDIFKAYRTHPHYPQLEELLGSNSSKPILLQGLSGSASTMLFAALIENTRNCQLGIFDDKDAAAYFYSDIKSVLPQRQVFFFPSSYKRSVQYKQAENGNIILRTNVLNQLIEFNQNQKEALLLFTYPEALAEKVSSKAQIDENTLHLQVGEKISIDFIHEVLDAYGFELVDFVYEPGQFALRGGLVDVFSYTAENPYRIDFFGDEVETIRTFEVESQLSKDSFIKISILPNLETRSDGEKISLLEILPPETHIWCSNIDFISERIKEISKNAQTNSNSADADTLLSGKDFLHQLGNFPTIELSNKAYYSKSEKFIFNTRPQPAFKKNFVLLGDDLKNQLSKGYLTAICSDNEKQHERLKTIFDDTHKGIDFKPLHKAIHSGFIDDDLKICCYTDHEIFDRYHKYQLHGYHSGKAALSLRELKDLKPGDYVVHIDHGIGQFGGLERVIQNGKAQEVIRLVYRDNDVIQVSIHALHRISKYKGQDDAPPRVHKLGSGAWQKLKSTTKKKVKDIAKDLILLYAQRKAKQGYRFSKDTFLQEELEASFIYEDTPDQEKATRAVKADMERLMPMDRLVCGDVGFGKTEIAIRAAFKAVTDNKQVAILVPTTILALQHYNTFRERLKDFPCTVDYICRLRKPSDQKIVLEHTAEGKVNILIGTHRLLGKDIKFKDLGLLIIDEEQKFGVSAKEKLKAIKVDVDTLALTATPIPRTLQFSLMGARDLSVINTPPPNRHPVITEVHTFHDEILIEGINYEVSRGGQVFIINNRIQNIYELETYIRKLCPQVKTVVGHGQMEGPQLEQVMVDFINGDFDVLIATAIIESGLDIPNANTIFINNAQNFGLSDLHQLRGRVGRSNRKAFCYLLAPPVATLTPEARRRLKAIEEFTDLGSGLHISLQDLDIRGAGNLLGAEQSGYITDIGFETYNRILDEALQELKENEYKDLFQDEVLPETTEKTKFSNDCVIDTDLEVLIPESYIGNIAERIRLYRDIDAIKDEETLERFKLELTDRFGALPKATEELLKIVRLRWLAMELGFEKLVLKNKKLILYFISSQDSAYFNSPEFSAILQQVQKNPTLFRMKEGQQKLTLSVENVRDIDHAIRILNTLFLAP